MDVKKIIEAINKEGRQGPKDLKSQEVYNWVKKQINISYDEYKKILDLNSIDNSKRDSNRDAFFVINSKGEYKLFKSNEAELRKYVCYLVRENPKITSGDLRKKFKLIYQEYTPIDLMDQKNLSSKQDIIDQTVRNILVSNYFKKKNNILFNRFGGKEFTYTITDEGLKLASEVDEILQFNKEIDEAYDTFASAKGINYYTEEELEEIFIKNQDFDYYTEYAGTKYDNGRLPTDSKLKATRFNQVKYTCECDLDHKTFETEAMPNFVVAHHLVPMSTQKNFASVKLDCIQNLVALCPKCHSQIHYGNRKAKKEIFDKIIEKRKDDLEKIGFTKPMLKVVFDTYY